MTTAEETIYRTITVPEYYIKYIDPKVSLIDSPKQCCPFHKEDTPSFIYNSERGIWRCFGACKVGGDVIALHQKNRSLSTRKEAIKDLCRMLGINLSQHLTVENILNHKPKVNTTKIKLENLITKLEFKQDVHVYCEMDRIVSYNLPINDLIKELEKLL